MSELNRFVGSLSNDVQKKELKLYVASTRLKNFAAVVPQKARILLCLHLDPDLLMPIAINMRDARKFGRLAAGDLEISISSCDGFEQAKSLIVLASEGRASV